MFITGTFHVRGHRINMRDASLHEIASFYCRSGTHTRSCGHNQLENRAENKETKSAANFFGDWFGLSLKLTLISTLIMNKWDRRLHSDSRCFSIQAVRLTSLSWFYQAGVRGAARQNLRRRFGASEEPLLAIKVMLYKAV